MKFLPVAILATILATVLAAQAPKAYKGKEEKLPQPVAPQPLPFSHKKHAAAGSVCADCHPGARKSERAGFPDAARCMLCHRAVRKESPEIRKLAAMHKEGRKLEWVRIYRVPEFVFFDHSVHTLAGLECRECHGPAEERDVLVKEVSTSMTACMNCHASRQVSNDCHFCHALGF